MHTTLGLYLNTICNMDMSGYSSLSSNLCKISDTGTSCNTCLSCNNCMLSHYYVMCNLHQVIYFRTLSNTCDRQGASVDNRIGPDLDIIFNDDFSYMTDFLVMPQFI